MATSPEAHFRATAPRYMRRLQGDFPQLDDLDVAAVFGNAGHESKGLTDDQEDRPVVKGSRGGLNWFQWTGARRRAIEAFARKRDLDPAGDEAAYLFLVEELRGPEKKAIPALRRATTLKGKVEAFEKAYERAGVKHYPQRLRWAQIALDALRGGKAVADQPKSEATPELVRMIQQALYDKGYVEVGRADGRYGPKTRAAILAFEDQSGLPLKGDATERILKAITDSGPRPVAEERAEATPAEVREQVPEARMTWLGQVWAWIIGLPAALWAMLKGVFDDLGLAREQVQPFLDLLSDVPGWVYGLVVAALAVTLYLQQRKGNQHIVEAYQTGERR